MEQYFQRMRQSLLFEPLRSTCMLFDSFKKLPDIADLNNLLAIDGIRFVPQAPKSSLFEDSYEPRIFLRGEVQTREQNWHDFFNAMVWHQFPKAKRRINSLHYREQKSRFPDKKRGATDNMLTIFDEHGVVAISSNADLLDLIRERRWRELFFERRDECRAQLKLIIFGHGLYEKSLNPYIGLAAHSLLFHHDNPAEVDSLVEQFFLQNETNLSTKIMIPIPILGYPGWWPHQDETFYRNEKYYRP